MKEITTPINQSNPYQDRLESELKAIFELMEKDFTKTSFQGKSGSQIEKMIGEMFG